MQLALVTASLCLLGWSLAGVTAQVSPPVATQPQLQIVYNDKLRQAMKRFNITETDMSEMLTSYMENGKSPTITKSILNPETGLQETITLDFQGFTKEWSSSKPSTPTPTLAAPAVAAARATVPVVSEATARLDARDFESLEEQKRHLMRGMMVLDAESTDLTADFDSGMITQHLYRQRMLDNRELYRALMTQLIKVQSLLDNYKTTNPGAARRDSSRVVSSTTNSTNNLTNNAFSTVTQQPEGTQVSSQTDAMAIQQKARELEELLQRNALLKLRLREEQEKLSSAGQSFSDDITSGDNLLFGNTPLRVTDSLRASFQRQAPRQQRINTRDNTLPVVQDPDIFIHPLVTTPEENAITEEPSGGILTTRTDSAPSLINNFNNGRTGDRRQSLLAEYQRLQIRKRVINQILQRAAV